MADDNCWGAFGSDDDDDDDDNEDSDNHEIKEDSKNNGRQIKGLSKSKEAAASEVALFLTKSFLHANSKVPIGQRRIAVANNCGEEDDDSNINAWRQVLTERGFADLSSLGDEPLSLCDAILLLMVPLTDTKTTPQLTDQAYENLVPGGLCLVVHDKKSDDFTSESIVDARNSSTKWLPKSNGKETATPTDTETVFENDDIRVVSLQKRLCQVQERSCPWLSSKHSIVNERNRVEEATVPLSADEIKKGQLTEPSYTKAVERMQDYGYCILPRLLDPKECQSWGAAVLADLRQASDILLEREGVDIFHPHSSTKDPQSYKELSMREDLRMDLRDGPRIREMRGGGIGGKNNKPIVLQRDNTAPPSFVHDGGSSSSSGKNGDTSKPNPFFRQNASMLQVVRRTMNPKLGALFKGNFGRYNFDGSGPDGSFQDMRLSAIGGIVSLPGSADQALHADTPHLFENQTLPAHYINAFALGCAADPQVGCTAFVHGSHNIEFTAKYMADDNDNDNLMNNDKVEGAGDKVFEFLVRPQLELGDVILFDCRTLHFGLANMSDKIERPLLYCNMTHAWFHDPKNWDNHHPIFDE